MIIADMDADSSHPSSFDPEYSASYSDAINFDFATYVMPPESKGDSPNRETAQSDIPSN